MKTTKKVQSSRTKSKKEVSKKKVAPATARSTVQLKEKSKNKQKIPKNKVITPKQTTSVPKKNIDKITVNSSKKVTTRIQKKTHTSNFKKLTPFFLQRIFDPLVQKMTLPRVLLTVLHVPINLDIIAVQTARIGGFAIVVCGAFFTVLFSQYVWGMADTSTILGAQSATTVCSRSIMNDLEYMLCTKKYAREEQSTYDDTSFDAQDYSNSQTQDNESSVDQLNTEEITIPTKASTTIHTQPLSHDQSTTDQATTTKQSSEYNIIHSEQSSIDLTTVAHPSSEENITSAPNNVDTSPEITVLQTATNPAVGEVQFNIQVENARTVTVFAHNVTSGFDNRLGVAQSVNKTHWRYIWDTTTYSDGDYVLSITVDNEYGSYSDEFSSITTKNTNKVVSATSSISTSDTEVIPVAKLVVRENGILSGIAYVQVKIQNTEFVELWARPKNSYNDQIFAMAKHSNTESDLWTAAWDTIQIPNGEYSIFARIKNTYGIYKSDFQTVTIFNKPFVADLTKEQIQQETDIETAQELEKEKKTIDLVYNDRADSTATTSSLSENADDTEVNKVLQNYSDEINVALRQLTAKYRSNDPDTITLEKDGIQILKQEIKNNLVKNETTETLKQDVDTRIDAIVATHKAQDEKINAIITQRVGAHVFKDSDSDGITDYDERTIYHTNLYSADTDNDGIIDGIEIKNGYDPLSSVREVPVIYQSPKNEGVVRNDIFAVKSITEILPDQAPKDTYEIPAQAIITGKGLPNSFVTIYIYSTPIILTVRTDENGAWEYTLDKELEDGKHNIYVGVTDNAGHIVAKSEAFSFVKKAHAFTPADAATLKIQPSAPQHDSLLSTYMIYLILSISVVSIGLVLILLGLHLEAQNKKEEELIIPG